LTLTSHVDAMLHRQPYVGFVLFYISGLLLWACLEGYIQFSSGMLLGITTLLLLFAFIGYYRKAHVEVSMCWALFLMTCGMARMAMVQMEMDTACSILKSTKYRVYTCLITSLAEKRTNSIRFEAQIENIRNEHGWIPVQSKTLLYLPKDAPVLPSSGDVLIVSGMLSEPLPALNPEEFDYQLYLRRKGIGWTSYLNPGHYEVIRADHPRWWQWPIFASEWADQQFKVLLQDNQTYGLVKAMLLGRRDDLRSEQIDDYITSGTVHILSVSGMHVMLIFLVLRWLLSWLKHLPHGQYLYLGVICLFIGFYALLTGFQPAVQRATCMCFVMVIAETFRKKSDSINILAVSAFIILLYDPMSIYDVGFQLSYLAMLGIFLFYQPLEALVDTHVWIYKSVWQITAMSLAAQLATFPLSIYYFHQFPMYFWLINPLVITATNILLPAAMVLLCVSLFPFSYLVQGVGWVVDLSAYLANASVAIPSKLPHYLLESLYLNVLEVFLLYGLLLGIWYALDRRHIRLFRGVILSILPFSIYAISARIQTFYTSKALIHAIPKHTVLTFKEGAKLYVFSDTSFPSDTAAIQFHLKNYQIKEGIGETIYINAEEGEPVAEVQYQILQKGQILIHWKDKIIYYGEGLSSHPGIHYQILTGAAPYPNWRFDGKLSAHLFLDGEMSYFNRKKWEERLRQKGLPYYTLDITGAYSMP
jgi:competence protein ComEC